MLKYEIIIYWSEEDKVYIADVPELPGCSAHGQTYDVALINAKEAIQLWIDKLIVESVSAPDPETAYPVCLEGARSCPPEDCGSTFGYEELLKS